MIASRNDGTVKIRISASIKMAGAGYELGDSEMTDEQKASEALRAWEEADRKEPRI